MVSMSSAMDQNRVSRREFVQRAARRAGLPLRTMQQAYDGVIDELLDLVEKGNTVTLTGFGKFYPQRHKGHRVVFGDDTGTAEINDYAVLKFSATREVNRAIAVPPKVPDRG